MRVLFVNWGGQSHLFPMVPLAWACRAAGHEVRVATQPGLVPVAAATGLPVMPVGSDVDVPALVRGYASRAPAPAPAPVAAAGNGRGRTPRALAMVVALAEAMAPDLLRRAGEYRPDLVVFETTRWAGPLVAGALGVPICVTWGTTMSKLGIVPQLPDHATHARQVAASGAGLTVPRDDCDTSLRQVVSVLLGDASFRAAAQTLRQRMLARPAPADLVPVLEKLAGV